MNRQMNFSQPRSGSILITFTENKNPEVFFSGETDKETLSLHRWLDENFDAVIPPNPPTMPGKERQIFSRKGNRDGNIRRSIYSNFKTANREQLIL